MAVECRECWQESFQVGSNVLETLGKMFFFSKKAFVVVVEKKWTRKCPCVGKGTPNVQRRNGKSVVMR